MNPVPPAPVIPLPPAPPPPSKVPYIVAFVILTLIGSIFILGILKLRPDTDPIVVLAAVFAWVTASAPAVFSYLKADETHITVNSQMEVFKATLAEIGRIKAELAYEQGKTQGTSSEQSRVEDKRAKIVAEKQVLTVETDPKKPEPPAPPSKSFLS